MLLLALFSAARAAIAAVHVKRLAKQKKITRNKYKFLRK
jgi:hypothetical protein